MRSLHSTLKRRTAFLRPSSVLARRRLVVGGMLLSGMACLLVILAHEPLLTWFAYRFRAEDPQVPSDAIVVLLSGWDDRPSKAAELYRQGLAPVILIGQTKDGGTARHRDTLMRGKVPDPAIRILPGGVVRSTHDEALRVRDYVRTHPVRRIIVATSAYHTARARWTFRRVLQGTGVEVRMVASQDPRFTESDWYTKDQGISQYLSEALKTLYYRLAY